MGLGPSDSRRSVRGHLHMRVYQIFKIEPDGAIANPCLVIRCKNDGAAVTAGRREFGEDHDLEIWLDNKFVATIPPGKSQATK